MIPATITPAGRLKMAIPCTSARAKTAAMIGGAHFASLFLAAIIGTFVEQMLVIVKS
jgi:hypothetical protein